MKAVVREREEAELQDLAVHWRDLVGRSPSVYPYRSILRHALGVMPVEDIKEAMGMAIERTSTVLHACQYFSGILKNKYGQQAPKPPSYGGVYDDILSYAAAFHAYAEMTTTPEQVRADWPRFMFETGRWFGLVYLVCDLLREQGEWDDALHREWTEGIWRTVSSGLQELQQDTSPRGLEDFYERGRGVHDIVRYGMEKA